MSFGYAVLGFGGSDVVPQNWIDLTNGHFKTPLELGIRMIDFTIISPTRAVTMNTDNDGVRFNLIDISVNPVVSIDELEVSTSNTTNALVRKIDSRYVMGYSNGVNKGWIIDTDGDELNLVGSANTISIQREVAISPITTNGTFIMCYGESVPTFSIFREIWTPNTTTGVISRTTGVEIISEPNEANTTTTEEIIDMGNDRYVFAYISNGIYKIRVMDEDGVAIGTDVTLGFSPVALSNANGTLLVQATNNIELYSVDGTGATLVDSDTPTIKNRALRYLETIDAKSVFIQQDTDTDDTLIEVIWSYEAGTWLLESTVTKTSTTGDYTIASNDSRSQQVIDYNNVLVALVIDDGVDDNASLVKIKLR